ncbi:MAG: DUF6263 family protein [Bacteroidales bacterium]
MKKILVTIAAMVIANLIVAQTNLKLNLEKNKVYRLKSTSEQTLTQTINGVQQTTNIQSNSVVSIKMVDAKADFIIASVKFDTITTNTNAMGKIVNMTSLNEGNMKSEETADVMSCIMNRLSKNPLFVKMDYSGKVIELVNQKMLADIVLKDTALITGNSAQIIKMQIKNYVDSKSLISMVEGITNNLPDKQNAGNKKWTNNTTTNAGGMSLDISTAYSMGEIKGTKVAIEAESNIQASPNAEPMDYGTAKITYGDLKGISKSDIFLDAQSGLISESKSKTHIAGNLNVAVQGMNIQMPMDMDIEAKIVSLP